MILGDDRFEIQERLGSGGMGVVYRARDRETGTDVALKTLHGWDADDAYRLKHEFRLLADIRHPNLVELYELFARERECFFTMELVPGINILDALRLAAGHWEQVAELLSQLVFGLAAVHDSDRLHRDVKPSNVLVTTEQRVVILDFGLATAFRGQIEGDTVPGMFAGTPAYMPPEQLWALPLTPAADWYAVGTILYEALYGRRPFEGSPAAMLTAKARGAPTALRGHPSELPPQLSRLITALLDPDPAQRPSGDDILREIGSTEALHVPTGFVGSTRATAEDHFVGRAHELEQLHAAFRSLDSKRAVILLQGESGIGKTTLIRRFLDQIGPAVVLGGRCHPQETVPYDGFDQLVDQLSRFLLTVSSDELAALLPRYAPALTRMFPVLDRVPDITKGHRLELPAEPQEIRRRGFAAFRELMTRIADRRRLVLWIDDAQWGGSDSAALLREIIRAPDAPPLMVIISCRTDSIDAAEIPATIREADPEAVNMRLTRLGPTETRQLAQALAETDAADIEAVVADSEGSPFLITQLANRRVAGRMQPFQEIIRKRVAELPDDAQLVLGLVALAGGPIERGVLLRAARLGEAGRRLVATLQNERLLRVAQLGAHPTIETYHDRIREDVVEDLDPAILVERHRALAYALEDKGGVEPDRLANHLYGAGEYERASQYAAAAGDRAAAALAFAQAAHFYTQACQWWPATPERRADLRACAGRAMVNAGRCAEGAALFLAASAESGPARALELRQSAAEQFLAGGHFDEGVSVLTPLLTELGLRYPKTARAAGLLALGRLLRLAARGTQFRVRASEVPMTELLRADLCYAAAKAFVIIDPARGVYFAVLGLLLSLRTGEPARVCRSLALVGGSVLSVAGGPLGRAGRRLLHQAVSLARTQRDPYLIGMTATSMGPVYLVAGDWPRALRYADRGVRLLSDRCRGVSFECAIGRMASLRALEELGNVRELCRRAEEMLAAARETGDVYAEVTAATYAAFGRLTADDSSGARSLARQGLARWSREGFHIQHLYAARIEIYCDLYDGRPEDAEVCLRELWPALAASSLLRVPLARVDAYLLRARVHLALAVRDHHRLAGLRRDAHRMAREGRPEARAHAALLHASVAWLEGAAPSAIALCEQAAQIYDNAHMTLHAIYARRRSAEIADKCEQVTEADRRVRDRGVKDPAKWAAIYAPGAAVGAAFVRSNA